jgi:hypothetical protein
VLYSDIKNQTIINDFSVNPIEHRLDKDNTYYFCIDSGSNYPLDFRLIGAQ